MRDTRLPHDRNARKVEAMCSWNVYMNFCQVLERQVTFLQVSELDYRDSNEAYL